MTNLAAIGTNLITNPDSTIGSDFIKYLALTAGGVAIVALFSAASIAVVLAAGAASTAVASAGGLGAVVAVCANNPITATIVTGLVSGVAGVSLPQNGV